MKTMTNKCSMLFILMLTAGTAMAQTQVSQTEKSSNTVLKTYMIEREIPDAGNFTPETLKAISQKSCGVLKEMGPQIEWVHSYVLGNKIVCIYKAANEELIREHARKGGFPANKITEVKNIISPATAD